MIGVYVGDNPQHQTQGQTTGDASPLSSWAMESLEILRGWGCSDAEALSILRPDDPDANDRDALIFALNALIQRGFSSQSSRDCFPRMRNNNPGFNGRSLIERLQNADTPEFERTYEELSS